MNVQTDFSSDFDIDDSYLVLSQSHTYYPLSLIDYFDDKAPSNLYCVGNSALLGGKRAVMICGARNASQSALMLAYRCAQILVQSGQIVLSGLARGIDCAAHAGAFAGDGDTIAFLPYGFNKLKIPSSIASLFLPERFLAITELKPHYSFSVRNALRRNMFMAAIAQAVIVVEPGDTGGSWYSARTAGKLGKPLFYIEGERPDCKEKIEEYGAQCIDCSQEIPNLDDVLQCVTR